MPPPWRSDGPGFFYTDFPRFSLAQVVRIYVKVEDGFITHAWSYTPCEGIETYEGGWEAE